MEAEWFEYVDEMGGSQGRCKKHKTHLEEEDADPVPNLPGLPTEMVFFGDDDYQPDCPWTNSLMKEEMTILMSGMKLIHMGKS